MIGRAALVLALGLSLALTLSLGPLGRVRANAAAEAEQASAALAAAIAGMQAATGAQDRVAALTRTIQAYEAGLTTLRGALRNAALRQEALERELKAKRGQIGQLVGALGAIEAQPGPLLLLHPGGPLGTVRSGMVMADVTPALQAQAQALRAQLAELARLQALQETAAATLRGGLDRAQTARAELSQAISARADLPQRLVDDPVALEQLLGSAASLQAFAEGLPADQAAPQGFSDQIGRLPLPVLGRVVLRPGEVDSRGVKRPGLHIATRAVALITAPWAATVRYMGPLLDYGNVMILEPGDGFLMVLSGMDTVYVQTGDVVAAGDPLGMMGGDAQADADLTRADGEGAEASETLYLELRRGAEPVDPTDWFAPQQG